LQDLGIVVHQIPPLRSDEQDFLANLDGNACQLFPRDPILVVGKNYLELPLLLPYRRRERFPIRRAVMGRLQGRNGLIRSAPEPLPFKGNKNGFGPSAFLEGGDVLVFEKRLLVGMSGNASNRAGVAWLSQVLGPSYSIEIVPLKPNFLHIDVALCTPRPGLAIVCKAAFPYGLPALLQGWDLIEVDEADALGSLACNALVLDSKSLIVVDKPRYLARRLERAGQIVYPMPFNAITPLGGGFRCWHHPLLRVF
jgi:N-dimethylarginine dimethylaminohydrolase